MKLEPLRLLVWLLAGLALYAVSMYVGTDNPQLQQGLWKAGHVTVYGWVGYWISRAALGRVERMGYNGTPRPSQDGALVARALLIGLAMNAGAHGL